MSSRLVRGRAQLFSRSRNRIAVLVEGRGGYVVFDLMGPGQVDLEDEIGELPLLLHGRHRVRNASQNRVLDVFIEAWDATPASARQLIDAVG